MFRLDRINWWELRKKPKKNQIKSNFLENIEVTKKMIMIIWTKNWKTFFEKLKPKTSISCYLFFSGCNKTNTSVPERLHASLLWCKSPKELLMLLLAHQNLFPSKQPAWFLLSMSQSKALKLRKSIQHWKSTSVLCMGKLNGRNHQKVPLTVIFYAHQTKNPPKVHAWLFFRNLGAQLDTS